MDTATSSIASLRGRTALISAPAVCENVPTLRRFALGVLATWGVAEDDRDSVALALSELAANACLHGRTTVVVHLFWQGGFLYLEVSDFGIAAPPPSPLLQKETEADEHGRGLAIVEAVAACTKTVAGPWGRRILAGFHLPSCAGSDAHHVAQAAAA